MAEGLEAHGFDYSHCSRQTFQVAKLERSGFLPETWSGPTFLAWAKKLKTKNGIKPTEAMVSSAPGGWPMFVFLVNHDIGEAMVCDVFIPATRRDAEIIRKMMEGEPV